MYEARHLTMGLWVFALNLNWLHIDYQEAGACYKYPMVDIAWCIKIKAEKLRKWVEVRY